MEGAEKWVVEYERGDREVKVLGKRLEDTDKDVMGRVEGYLWSCWVGGRDAKNVANPCSKYPDPLCSFHPHDYACTPVHISYWMGSHPI